MTSSGLENTCFVLLLTMNLSQEQSLKSLIELACTQFEQRFGQTVQVYAFAPGRVNLIGDHIDYNDGFVLPIAIPFYTIIAGAKNHSQTFQIETLSESMTEEKRVEFKAEDLKPGHPLWANYVKGVMANFPGICVPFNAVIVTSVPIGCGLSSSAALEVSMFSFLEGLSDNDLGIGYIFSINDPNNCFIHIHSMQEKAIICQRAEHLFANVPCGLMDQLIAVMGRENNALMIDCRSLETQLIEISDSSISFLVCNSNVRHSLADSEYSNRRKVCEQVASLLGKSSLRDVSMRELETSRNVLTEQMYFIARHVITEISRTESAAEALKAKDYTVFGTLMTQSHISLRDDYKVSCAEVDELVEATLKCDGVYGSRMTGGGFGGCTVTLVKSAYVDKVVNYVRSKYRGSPEFFVVRATEGSHFQRL